MVARVHHATQAKAEKLGLVITGELEDSYYTVTWPERNKTLTATTAVQAVEDGRLFKMITLEYGSIKPKQAKDGRWRLFVDGEDLAEGRTLEEAWDDFTSEREPHELEDF